MLYSTASILQTAEGRELPPVFRNSLLEAFVVHFRALHEFLWKAREQRHKSDARAADYFEPGVWAKIRPGEEATVLRGPARVGREVAHLTYRRKLPADEWMVAQIAASVGRCFRVFLDNVDPRRVSVDFERRIRACWPHELNFPIAVSFPADHDPPGVATVRAGLFNLPS